MSKIRNINKISEKENDPNRKLVQFGLQTVLDKGKLCNDEIDRIEINQYFESGKTDAVVFRGKYGKDGKLKPKVFKIKPIEGCAKEYEGYVNIDKPSSRNFCELKYDKSDNFIFNSTDYGILLYEDVSHAAMEDNVTTISEITIQQYISNASNSRNLNDIGRVIGLCLKNIFIDITKNIYKQIRLQPKSNCYDSVYGKKLESKSQELKISIEELGKKSKLPTYGEFMDLLNEYIYYFSVDYIHGDFHPGNVLIWRKDDNIEFMVIDYGEIQYKNDENFTPIFWDFSRMLCQITLDFCENYKKVHYPDKDIDFATEEVLNQFFPIFNSYWLDGSIEAENSDFQYITNIYMVALYGFIDSTGEIYGVYLTNKNVLISLLYDHISFFIFFAKFKDEGDFKRLLSLKLSIKLKQLASEIKNLNDQFIFNNFKNIFQAINDKKYEAIIKEKKSTNKKENEITAKQSVNEVVNATKIEPSFSLESLSFNSDPDQVDYKNIILRLHEIKIDTGFGALSESRLAIPIDFGWVREAYLEPNQNKDVNYIELSMYPGDTKAMGYSLYYKPMDWLQVKSLNVEDFAFKLEITPYIKFSHFNAGISYIWLENDKKEFSKKTHTQVGFESLSYKWSKEEWPDLESKFDKILTFDWRKESKWQEVFLDKSRSYVVISLGFKVSIYLPYEVAQMLDSKKQNYQFSNLVKKTINEFKNLVETPY